MTKREHAPRDTAPHRTPDTPVRAADASLETDLQAAAAVLDSLPVGLLIASATDGGVSYANWSAAALFEQQPEALIGSDWPHARWVHALDGAPFPKVRLPLWRSLHDGESVPHVELTLELPSGTRRDLLASSAPLRDAEGQIVGAAVVYRDASQLRALQAALSQLNGELRRQGALVTAIVEQAPMPVAVTSHPEGRLLLANSAYRRATAAEADLDGRRLEEVIPEAGPAGLLERREQAIRERATQLVPEFRRATPKGETYWAVAYTPLADAGGEIDRVLELWQNVTTQVMAQRHLEAVVRERTRELETEHQRLESLVVAGMSLASERSQEGVLQRLSEVSRELLQARRTTLRVREVNGKTSHFTASEAPVDPTKGLTARSISEALRELLGAEGTPAYAGLGAEPRSRLEVPVICRGQVFGQLQVMEKRGEESFSDTDEVLAVGLAAQAAVALESVRLFQELKAQQDRLARAERLSAIGTLAGGIAHDLRQPLNVLKLTVQLLRQAKTPRSEAERRQLARLEQHVDQAAQIIQDLLALARDEPPLLAPTDLNALVDQFIASYAFPTSIHVVVERDSGAARVPVDVGQIRQVLYNLTRNAAEAMSETPGALLFRIRRSEEWAEIELRDEGPGIPPDQLSQVFEPLFTTRRSGTGLGLTLCQRIVTAHSGEIELTSEVGVGTCVVVRLPAS